MPPGIPTRPAADEMLTTEPRPRAIIPGTTATLVRPSGARGDQQQVRPERGAKAQK